MKTAGLALDFYDDQRGETLKSYFPTAADLPEAIKTAHILRPEEREVLRDEAYALILHNDGHQLRKFACVDAGNTVLSTLYFLENYDSLPKEAVKTAAINLLSFSEEFGLPIPEELTLAAETGLVVKTAGKKKHESQTGMSRKRDSLDQPFVGDEADWAQRTDLNKTMVGGTDSGRVTQSLNTMKTAGAPMPPIKKLVTDKAPTFLKGKYPQMNLMTSGGGLKSVMPGGAKEVRASSNVVDVSNLEPEAYVQNKTASRTALDGRYSLDSYSDVQNAVRFFSDSWTELEPAERHEFSVKTANRAEELGIEVPEMMLRYGGTEYSPDVEAHLANRRAVNPENKALWDSFSEKRASIDPEQFADLLAQADKAAGLDYEWGGAVFDPYYATFGSRSETEKVAWAWASADGETLSEEGLRAISAEKLGEIFDSSVVSAFTSDPTTIFDSMPDEQKKIIANLAQ
jgi:hypothetical protein